MKKYQPSPRCPLPTPATPIPKNQIKIMSANKSSLPEISAIRRQLAAETDKRQEVENRLLVADTTIDTLRKQIIVLQAAQTPVGRSSAAVLLPPGRGSRNSLVSDTSQQPIAVPRPLMANAQTASQDDKLRALQQENRNLIQCVKRQIKLIDVLKRQNILLEAATLLDLNEREFHKYLELEKST